MSQLKTLSQTRVGKFFGAVIIVFIAIASPHFAEAATRTSTATGGNWNVGSTWVGGVAPANADSVIIATTGGNTVNITANTTNAGLTVNSGAILAFTGTFTLTENGNVVDNGTINGSTGTIRMNAAGLSMDGSGTINSIILANRNMSFLSTANLTINNNINSPGRTVTNNGTVNLNGNYARTSGTAIWTQGTNSTLLISGAFTPAANVTLNASASGNTINYDGASQTIDAATYNNLVFSGAGAVSVVTGVSVSGNLSIAPAGSATASIGAGLNISVGTLTTGGLGTINGTWGSTSSSATNQEDTSFAATTGIVTVATDTRGSQATLTAIATPSTVIYGSTSTLSSTGGSGTGAVTFSAGASTGCSVAGTVLSVTNANGTCSITVTKAADKHYLSATSAAVTVTLVKKTLTVTGITANDKPYDGNTTATLNTGSAALVGVISGDSVTLNTASAVGTFATSSVGTGILVTISGLTISGASSGNYSLTQPTTTASITSAVASQFTLSHPGTMNAKSRVGYTVTRKDQFGGLVTNGTTTAYLYTNSTSTNAKFYNDSLSGSQITSATISNGQSSASFWYYDDNPGTVTITASDNSSAPDGAAGLADATDMITILPVAVKFVILQPSNGTVDAPIAVTVQAQKSDGSVDTNYQQGVTLNTTGSATGGGLVTIVNGVGTKNISDTVAETVTLSLTDSQSTGLDVSSSKQVTFGVGALAQYTLNHPGTIAAGSRAAYTVTRKDQYGNLVTSGASTVYLYSSSTAPSAKFYPDAATTTAITSITISDGSSAANFWYSDQTIGTWTIYASDNATAPNGAVGINDGADALVVTFGPTAQFLLNHPGTITAGTRAAYTVTRKDAYGNLTTSGSANVYLYSSSSNSSSSFYLVSSGGSPTTFVNIADAASTANFWYTDGTAETVTITASDNATAPDGAAGIADATDTLIVSAAPIVATRLVILDPPAATVDAAAAVTIEAQNGAGSLDTTFNGTVTLNTTGSATGGGVVTITNGVGTQNISDNLAQTVMLTLADTGSTGLDVSSSKTLTFAPGVIAQFSVSSPGDLAAGSRQALTIGRKDQFGNGVVSGLTTAYLYSASASSNKRFYDSAISTSSITFVNFTNGVSSTQVWYYDEAAATTTVTISDNSTAPDGLTGVADASAFIHVVPASAAQFILSNPGSMFVGTRAPYTVTRKDAYGNLVTSGINLAYLYSNSTSANKKFYDSASGGLVITSIPIDNGFSTANFWYYDDTAGTWTVSASNNASGPSGTGGFVAGTDSITVSLVPIVATRFVILPAGPSQIGTPVAVIIQAEDNSGNIQTDYNNSVTLNVSGSATGGGVISITNGIGIASVNDLTAETVALSLTDSNSTGLNVASTQNLVFSTVPVLTPSFQGGGRGAAAYVPVVGGVSFGGRAYPGATVSIVALGATANLLKQSAPAASDGTFQVDFRGISTGAAAYGFLVQDRDGQVSQSRTFGVNLRNKSEIIQVTDILASPTINFPRTTVTKGDRLVIMGYSSPGSTVSFNVDGKRIVEKVQAGGDGSYKLLLRTGELALGSHTVIAFQQDQQGRYSDPSIQKVFNVTNLLVPQVDFNGDGKINVTDASIFLSRFNSADPKIKILDDLNNDGKVDASDFSIFLRTLRLQP